MYPEFQFYFEKLPAMSRLVSWLVPSFIDVSKWSHRKQNHGHTECRGFILDLTEFEWLGSELVWISDCTLLNGQLSGFHLTHTKTATCMP